MNIYYSKTYGEDLACAIDSVVNIGKLKNESILVTGATGLIGSYIVDLLLKYDMDCNAGISVYALGRSKERLEERFSYAS